ncbi:MAG TPA: SHOCT domain-containing protein [Kineosporiaceae bacterium]|nr:SHOCT domain-containing protein [Kineosporiaceae bacterium]
MRLAPRQLRRYGMTGDVPYYGGRLTPAHIDAITRSRRPAAPVGTAPPPAVGPPAPPAVGPTPPPVGPAASPTAVAQALQHLLDAGVITQAEFEQLRARRLR